MSWPVMGGVLFGAQLLAAALLWKRLGPGWRRRAPVPPRWGEQPGAVTILLPTLNEAARLGPCLDALAGQDETLREVLVIDSGSTDGTQELVRSAALRDPRVRLLQDPPLPAGWIGKVWALQHGWQQVRSDWVLGIDADITPRPGFVGGVLAAAQRERLALVSFAPRFAAQSAAERLVQPAMLASLVYRTGVPGDDRSGADRVLANGQCFLVRRDVLVRHGGYASARGSFCDDVTLARQVAAAGERVRFLDGSALFQVRAYSGLREMWREWGRSIALRDAASGVRHWSDIAFLALVQATPLPACLLLAVAGPAALGRTGVALLSLNGALLATRLGLLVGLRHSYARRGPTFWLSPLADVAAVARVLMTTLRPPRRWRGRSYGPAAAARRISCPEGPPGGA